MSPNVSFNPSVNKASQPLPSATPQAKTDDGFAKLLSQRQAEAVKEPVRPPEPSKETAKAPAKEPVKQPVKEAAKEPVKEPAEERVKETSAEQPKSPEAVKKPAGKSDGSTKASDKQARIDRAGSDALPDAVTDPTARAGAVEHADADAATMDPALADWMATLQPQAPVTPEATGKALVGTDAAGTEAAGTEEALAGTAGRGRGALPQAADAALKSPLQGVAAAAQAVTAHDDFAAQLTSELTGRADELPATRFDMAHVGPAAGAAGSHATTPASASHAAAASASIDLPTPVNSPEFPQALGIQLSVLAKGGVQQAELTLNPAEMGPIAVQIALDGSKAQVDFAAASAATRQILENSLPELASALRDAGLTLTGGGVFQQPRQQRQGDDAGGREGGSDRRGVDGVQRAGEPGETRRSVRVAAGGVDLYA
jgi:flagellar hook-length control protein FliK